MSIVSLYTFVLNKLQAALVQSSENADKRAKAKQAQSDKVVAKALIEAKLLNAEATVAALESTQLADRAAKLKALL